MTKARHNFFWLILLFLSTFVFYFKTTGFDFVNYDDYENIRNNAQVLKGLNLSTIHWAFGAGLFFSSPNVHDWMPLVWVSRLIDVSLFGQKAWGHHLTNVFFHSLNACLLFLWLKQIGGRFWVVLGTTVIFIFHPIQVETVAWVTARKDLLGTFFSLVSLLQHTSENHRTRRWALLTYVCGVLSKPSFVLLPLLFICWDLGWLKPNASAKKVSVKPLLVSKWPYLLCMVLLIFATIKAQNQMLTYPSETPLPFRILTHYGFYLFQFVWPARLTIYGHVPVTAFAWTGILFGCALLVLGTRWALRGRAKNPMILGGWAWFVLTLLPVMPLQVQADRYMYWPIIGLSIFLLESLIDRLRILSYQVFLGLATLLMVFLSWQQADHWKNSETLFKHALSINDQNYTAHTNYGCALMDAGQFDRAKFHFERSLELAGDSKESLTSLGVIEEKMNRAGNAIAFHQKALIQNPDFAEAHFNLANAYDKLDQNLLALDHYQKAIYFKNNYWEACFNMAQVYEKIGQPQKAEEFYLKAVEILPSYVKAHNNLSVLMIQQNRLSDAETWLKKAVRYDPKHLEARNNLGITLAKQGKWQESIQVLEETARLYPQSIDTWSNLAITYKKTGQLDKSHQCVELIQKLSAANPS